MTGSVELHDLLTQIAKKLGKWQRWRYQNSWAGITELKHKISRGVQRHLQESHARGVYLAS
jgi:hypothetical protein